jgi:hypothetical protein
MIGAEGSAPALVIAATGDAAAGHQGAVVAISTPVTAVIDR